MDIDKDAAGDGGLVRHIADKPPGVMHVSDEEKERLIDGLEAYLQTLPSHWRRVARLLAGLQSGFPSIRTVMADAGYESRKSSPNAGSAPSRWWA